jgi:hypothetical protein
LKNRKHRFTRCDQVHPPHELTDDMVREMMPGASPDTLAMCEVALDPTCPKASTVCKNILLKWSKCQDK